MKNVGDRLKTMADNYGSQLRRAAGDIEKMERDLGTALRVSQNFEAQLRALFDRHAELLARAKVAQSAGRTLTPEEVIAVLEPDEAANKRSTTVTGETT